MMCSTLRQTTFQIEKIKNAVNVDRGSAYHIFTTPGEPIGQIGAIIDFPASKAANEEKIGPQAEQVTIERQPASWLRRVLASLKS